MNLSKAARCVWTDSAALLLTLIVGLVISLLYAVPEALTLFQVLALELLVMIYPISVLAKEKGSRKATHAPRNHVIFEIKSFGLMAAVIAYANYLLFFARHSLSPEHIATSHPLYLQASALACLTIVFCQVINLFLTRVDEHQKVFTDRLWNSPKLLKALGLSLFVMLNIIYNPWLQPLLGTEALDIVDWLMTGFAAALYTGLRLLQRHTRQHTRHAVIKLHNEVH